jgi:paraquat-inducible protein A
MPPAEQNDIIACPGCDLLLEDSGIPQGMSAFCPRCGCRLYSSLEASVDKTLAISITGLILYFPAVLLPLITLDTLGLKGAGSILDSMLVLFESGFYFVAVMVFLTALFFPFMRFFLMFIVSFLLKFRIRCRCLHILLRTYMHIEEWGMPEVYMISVLVTIIKMYHMASIEYDMGFFCFTLFMLTAVIQSICFDRRRFWEIVESEGMAVSGKKSRLACCLEYLKKKGRIRKPVFAMAAGIALCHDCHGLSCLRESGGRIAEKAACFRCGAPLHFRKPASMEYTLAFLLTAIILFFPANLMPMMKVDYLGVAQYSTIMDGIIYFFEEGSYGIGAVILIASILVPMFKIVGIIMILCSIHFRWHSWLRHKAMMFRFIEFVGRWSMLDVFVVALLQAIVNFGFLTSIEAASGATYFSGVVVMTMFAAISFDPRLLWDAGADSPR